MASHEPSASELASGLARIGANIRRVERERLQLQDEFFETHPAVKRAYDIWLEKKGGKAHAH